MFLLYYESINCSSLAERNLGRLIHIIQSVKAFYSFTMMFITGHIAYVWRPLMRAINAQQSVWSWTCVLVNGSLNSQGSKAINGVVHGCLNRKFNFFDLE